MVEGLLHSTGSSYAAVTAACSPVLVALCPQSTAPLGLAFKMHSMSVSKPLHT